jgi:alkanesulfonate monooxygenase SsuD/methylene tetrahydromethanopterin reductase-like flavin-dependent oxidoreductase (luciferase family)
LLTPGGAGRAARAPSRSPLFGFDLTDYERLFAEKLELFARLCEEKPVFLAGMTHPALPGLQVFPRTASGALPTWVGIGGNPADGAVRLALMLAIIGDNLARFARLSELYHQATREAGIVTPPIGVRSPAPPASRPRRSTGQRTRPQCWRRTASGAC